MKLNPSKCTFGVSSGKFLRFMVSHRRIEANPDKIPAILDMELSRSIKEVQKAFHDLKTYLIMAPLLSLSMPSEELL